MKRFIIRLLKMVITSLSIGVITIGVIWLFSSYKELPFQTYVNYVFMSSFIFILIGLYTLKDSSNVDIVFRRGDSSNIGAVDDTGVDIMQAKSLYSKNSSKTVEEMNHASRFFSFSTTMLLVGALLIGFSYFASI